MSDDGGVPEGEIYTLNVMTSYTGSDPIPRSSSTGVMGQQFAKRSTPERLPTSTMTRACSSLPRQSIQRPGRAIRVCWRRSVTRRLLWISPFLTVRSSRRDGHGNPDADDQFNRSIERLGGRLGRWQHRQLRRRRHDEFNHAYAHGLEGGIGYSITVAADTSVGVFAADGGISVTAPHAAPTAARPTIHVDRFNLDRHGG